MLVQRCQDGFKDKLTFEFSQELVRQLQYEKYCIGQSGRMCSWTLDYSRELEFHHKNNEEL
jgi:hypothetical protein